MNFDDIFADGVTLEDMPKASPKINSEHYHTIFYAPTGTPIFYNIKEKKFMPGLLTEEYIGPFIGVSLDSNQETDITEVMLPHFLLKNPASFSSTAILTKGAMQTQIKQCFNMCRQAALNNMPRFKKIKRMNIKLFDKKLMDLLMSRLDMVMSGFKKVLPESNAMQMQASIVSQPNVIFDNNVYQIYDPNTNQYIIPDENYMPDYNFLVRVTYNEPLTIGSQKRKYDKMS